jgi:hypothetical protein
MPNDPSIETNLQLDSRPSKIVVVGRVGSMSREDGGCALIADIDEEATIPNDGSFFVRLQSWSEAKPPRHTTLESLAGKKVRIIIEVEGEV